jgi:predicted MPP superfamily phosphohydrolase
MPVPIQKRRRPSRHVLERILNALLLNGKVAAWSHRCGLHGRLKVVRHDVSLAGRRLPRPLTIAFASDFHAGPTTHDALFDELGEQIGHARPDVLLYGGDYVSFDARHVDRLQRLLGADRAPLGTYAVIGNHDIWNGRARVEAALREAGIELLVNRNIALPAPFDMVSICGIDDPWTGQPDLPLAFHGARPVRLFLMHSPDGLWHLSGERFDLAFAGHTHAGQLAWADGRPVRGPTGPLSRRYYYGRYPLDENGPLLVTSGVGCSGLPLRWNTSPELLVCTLR